MKLIISRKGFDSGCGGVPSPIGPHQEMVSLPIDGGSKLRYRDIDSALGNMATLARDLTKGRFQGHEPAHLDPDLDPAARPRQDGWRAALGQVGAAQSHMEGQGVTAGDVMLFFGWFRNAEKHEGHWRFVPGSEAIHACFGYLQIGESLRLGARPDTAALLAQHPWLEDHPHLRGERGDNNTLHIASPTLVLGGVDTGLPGAGHFRSFHPSLRLTAPGAAKSKWRIPQWLDPQAGGTGLSYHGDPARWSQDAEGHTLLQTVAKGQEFVADVTHHPQALAWIESTIRNGLGMAVQAKPRRKGP
jgi:hypothetical protein